MSICMCALRGMRLLYLAVPVALIMLPASVAFFSVLFSLSHVPLCQKQDSVSTSILLPRLLNILHLLACLPLLMAVLYIYCAALCLYSGGGIHWTFGHRDLTGNSFGMSGGVLACSILHFILS